MSDTFDRTGYIKQIQDSDLAHTEKAVLIYFATYSELDKSISVSAHTATKMAPQLSRTNNTVGTSIQRLKDAKLLTTVERKRRKFYVLPTEDQIAFYKAPKAPRKSQP